MHLLLTNTHAAACSYANAACYTSWARKSLYSDRDKTSESSPSCWNEYKRTERRASGQRLAVAVEPAVNECTAAACMHSLRYNRQDHGAYMERTD